MVRYVFLEDRPINFFFFFFFFILCSEMKWLWITFGFSTFMGLGCAALTNSPQFPTYPHPLSSTQVEAGLSAPTTAITVLGKGGAVLLLVLLFMAVTSSTSAELIAVSSLLTFDVYKTYFRPNTSSSALVQISHYGIVIFALVLAGFCCILNAVGLSLTWLLTCLGTIVGGAALPVGLVLLWPRMSTVATIASPWIGMGCGFIGWFITTWKRSGPITVTTTGDTMNALAGNAISFGMGILLAVVLSFIFPGRKGNFNDVEGEPETYETIIPDVDGGQQVAQSEGKEERTITAEEKNNSTTPEIVPEEKQDAGVHDQDTGEAEVTMPQKKLVSTGNDVVDFLESKQMEPMDMGLARKSERLAQMANLVYFLIAVILVPFTLFGTGYIFSKPFFTGWVVVAFLWIWVSMCICVIYPVVRICSLSVSLSFLLFHAFSIFLPSPDRHVAWTDMN